jgi:hypothetical protein
MGAAGRRLAESGFSDRQVATETLAVYRSFTHRVPSPAERAAP